MPHSKPQYLLAYVFCFRWDKKFKEERKRTKETISRMEREKQLELENAGYRFQALEKELQALRKEKSASDENTGEISLQVSTLQHDYAEMKALNEELEKEKRKLRSQFEE